MRLRVVLLSMCVCLGASPAFAQLPTPPSPWTPPLGIPVPPIGIFEVAGAPTLYVNCSTGSDGNPGTAASPRQTIPSPLAAGSVVQVQGVCAGKNIVANGTPAQPVFITGVNNATCNAGVMQFTGSYLIVENFIFDGCRATNGTLAGASFFALRRSIVRNTASAGSPIGPQGNNLVYFANEVHNNGDPTAAGQNDIHGIKPDTGDFNIWIVDNHMHHNGGDAIQIGISALVEPVVHHVYIGRNALHDDRENGVDIKRSRDVIVSQNEMYGYSKKNSSAGEAVITHDLAERVWVLNNRVHDSHQGVVCSGCNDYYVIGNVIYNIAHDPADAAYNPASFFNTAGILTYTATNSVHVNNTLWNVDSGISYASGTAKTEIVNNIVGNLLEPTHHIGLGSVLARGNAIVNNNLASGAVRLRLDGQAATSNLAFCVNCQTGDPLFFDAAAGNFRLTLGSPAEGNGIAHPAFAMFSALYGLDIAVDLSGFARPLDAWDIGAFELAAVALTPATKVRLIP